MAFRVKDFYSRLEWELGRGGFGSVYTGYRNVQNEDKEDCYCDDCEAHKQVAIKVEKLGGEHPCLQHEARVLRLLQGPSGGTEGIPRFHLFSRFDLPSKKVSLASTRPPTPAMTPRTSDYKKSPLSSPALSLISSTPSRHDLDLTAVNTSLPKEPCLALVMERLGPDIGSTFRGHLKANKKLEIKVEADTSDCRRKRPAEPMKREPGSPRPSFERSKSLTSTRLGWDVDTIAWVGCHLLQRMEHMHKCGYVHRDIKPENLCVGRGRKREILYLIDFGMATTYLTPNGRHIGKPAQPPLCLGTQSYMSSRCEGSRRDDIESIIYVLLYLYHGHLPWSNNANRFEESFARSGHRWTAESLHLNSDIQQQKKRFLNGEGMENLPKEMKAMLKHLITLRFHDKPDYHLLRTLLQDMKRRSKTELHIAPVLKTKPVIPHFKRQGYL